MLATTPLRGLADFKSAETALLIAARAVLCCHLTAIPLPAFSNPNIYNLPARTAVSEFLWPPWHHLVLFRAPSSCD